MAGVESGPFALASTMTIPLTAGSPEGARALARDHVLGSFALLEAILEQVGGTWPHPKRSPAKLSS